MRISYRIKTESPVIISTFGGDSNLINTLDYIPGSVVLGALANRYIKNKNISSHAEQNNVFKNLFLSDKVIFRNAYLSKNSLDFLPAPRFVKRIKDNNNAVEVTFEDRKNQETLSPYRGYIALYRKEIINAAVNKVVFFHNTRGIEENTILMGYSKENGIFNYEAISPFQEFTGEIITYDVKDSKEIENLISSISTMRIGRSKSSQYGKTTIQVINKDNYDRYRYFPHFDVLGNYDKNYIVMTAVSPIIVFNKYGFPEVNLDVMKQYLELIIGKIESIRGIFGKTFSERYVSAWKLKTPKLNAFNSGSTFLIKFKDLPVVKKKLNKLAKSGIGEFTTEGFGEIVFSTTDSKKTTSEKTNITDVSALEIEKEIEKPKTINVGKEIAVSVVKDMLNVEVERLAYEEAHNFRVNNTSSSLFSRLGVLCTSLSPREIKEAMLENNQSKNVKRLRDTALKQLQNVRNLYEYTTLKNYIEDNADIQSLFNNILPRSGEIKNILDTLQKITGSNIKTGKEFEVFRKHLHDVFWSNFFRALRKMQKGGSNND